jgi:pilus assembly protein CpaD
MARKTTLVSAIALFAIAGIGPLAGCAPPSSDWTGAEAANSDIKIDRVQFDQRVRFAPRNAALDEREQRDLAAFAQRHSLGYADTIYVFTGEPPSREAASLALGRAQNVRRSLVGQGVPLEHVQIATSPDVTGDQVAVVVSRHVATPPACPNWTKPSGGDATVTVNSNFGCATAFNLSHMVADPADLIRGRSTGPADGEQTTLGIYRYRIGKITPLMKDTGSAPLTGGGGGGGSGGASGGQ